MPFAVDTIAREALLLAAVSLLPVVGACIIAALVSSALQAMTQVRDPVLSFAPKLMAAGIALWVAGPWVLDRTALFLRSVLQATAAIH